MLLGSLTFTGSLMAFGKLQELLPSRSKDLQESEHLQPRRCSAWRSSLVSWLTVSGRTGVAVSDLPALALAFGVLLIMPIGGADMPTVIALLELVRRPVRERDGLRARQQAADRRRALDGSSGLILSIIMCKAMNRSFTNVLFGGSDASTVATADEVYGGKIKSATAEDIAMVLDGVRRVVIVPGYGMAVVAGPARGPRPRSTCSRARGADVEFAIHPVAGRMPGHMNVLLAEADIPYEKLKEMDEINPTFAQTDVVIVIGANDVVNPLANTDPQEPDRRHADPQRRRGPHGRGHQAEPEPRFRGHSQPAVRRRQHADVLRRRQEGRRRPGRGDERGGVVRISARHRHVARRSRMIYNQH